MLGGEQKVKNLSFSPEMLRECFLVDFGAGEEGDVDLVPEEVEGEDPEELADFLDSDITNFGFGEDAAELAGGGEGDQSAQILAVDVLFVRLFDLPHQSVELVGLPSIFLEELKHPVPGAFAAQVAEGLVHDV